jgi:hypothetical protein
MFDFELKKKNTEKLPALYQKNKLQNHFRKTSDANFPSFLPGTFYITTEKN